MRVAAFTGGDSFPSARFRVRQYIPNLRRRGILLDEYYPARSDGYPPFELPGRVRWLVDVAWQRLMHSFASKDADLFVFQRQMIPTISTLEWTIGRPALLDVDDAIYLKQRWRSVWSLARRCDGVICGNDFLAEQFDRHSRAVFVVPTAVDAERYRPSEVVERQSEIYLGWIGSSSGFLDLYEIEDSLTNLLLLRRDVRLLVVSDKPPKFRNIPCDRVLFSAWSAEAEVSLIQKMDIGLMPLRNTEWAQGKCSLKALQYMACGVPAVVSDIGMNRIIGRDGGVIAIPSNGDWIEALVSLIDSGSFRKNMGISGREAILNRFDAQMISKDLSDIFNKFA